MRYGIFSDIHSNLEALEAVAARYAREGIEQYFCAGDVVGYAANPNECVALVKKYAFVTVAGNHDWACVGLCDAMQFNLFATQALEWTRARLSDESRDFLRSLRLEFVNKDLTLVHGSLDNPEEFDYMFDSAAASRTFRILKTQVCFVGHTHVAGYFVMDRHSAIQYRQDASLALEDGNRYIVNVGSVGQPRDGNSCAAYCIYDTEKKEISIKRTEYQIDFARKKILESGLSRSLGDRLLTGS